jgi:DNA-binding IclR family transcriptional regulator
MAIIDSQQDEVKKQNNTTRTAARALDVLLCFNSETPSLTMTEISKKLKLNKSTVHRLLATLEEKRFVRRDPETGVYRLGFLILKMANLCLEDINIRHITSPYMRRLLQEFEETVDLAVLDGDEVFFVDSMESPKRIKLTALPGQHLPAYNTASGKAMLAFLPTEEAIRIYKKYNPNLESAKDPAMLAFLDDLQSTRERGYAFDFEALEAGIQAVAAPILGMNNKPIASLAIAGPAYRLETSLLDVMGKRLVSTAQEISTKIIQGK